MKRPMLWFIPCFFLAACGSLKKDPEDLNKKKFGPTGIPPHLRAKPEAAPMMQADGTLAPEVSVALKEHEAVDKVWTNLDNMWEKNVELEKLLAAPKIRNVWEKSEATARSIAIREGKCVMIWFTDSARSPVCKRLDVELLGRNDFGDWAKENLVRLKVDQSALQATGNKEDDEVIAVGHVKEMKKKYKALGTPTVIMLSPKGEVLAKYRGYKPGTAETFWGQLKYSVGVGSAEYQSWLRSLEKRGFRVWQDKQQRKVVARLVSYHQGQMSMVEPDGNRFRTHEDKLCNADQEWIKAEKKKRGIE